MGYVGFFIFFILIFLLGIFILLLPKILAPKAPLPIKYEPYECGEIPVGEAWSRYNVRFYLLAIAFIIFDVEAVFLFPWVLKVKDLGLFGFFEILLFVFILFCGWIYILKKGALKWN